MMNVASILNDVPKPKTSEKKVQLFFIALDVSQARLSLNLTAYPTELCIEHGCSAPVYHCGRRKEATTG
jgi:hypothetical protein